MRIKLPITDCRLPIEKRSRQPRFNLFTNRKSQIVNSIAFTLIEVMIAIVIFSLVMAAVYSTWYMIMRASRVAQDAAARAQRQRIAIQTLQNSLTGIQSFQASMQYYSFIVQNGDQPWLEFTARVPDDFPRSGRFGDFNVRRMIFDVEKVSDEFDGTSENDLVLRQYPILMSMDPDEQQTPYILARNVQAFTVECWDTNAQDWATEWDDTNSIPPLIRVGLELRGPDDNNYSSDSSDTIITRVISPPAETMPTQVQTPGRNTGGGAVRQIQR